MVFVPFYGMFCGLNSDGFGGRFVVLLGTGLVHVKELFWVKIWCIIATHMGFKTAASGCIAPAPL